MSFKIANQIGNENANPKANPFQNLLETTPTIHPDLNFVYPTILIT